MTSTTPYSPSVLIMYYSLSGQTRCLVHRLSIGMRDKGVRVLEERLVPIISLRFPIGTIPGALKMMLATFFRQRIPIAEVSSTCLDQYDLIILAGPTWSYNPSGPILSLIDTKGKLLFQDKVVLPLISCRGYWRAHWWGLKRLLLHVGAIVPNVIVFAHPCPEPWRTIGVFLKLAGKAPEKNCIIGRYYKRYGHSKQQQDQAVHLGEMLGLALQEKKPIDTLNFLSQKG